MHPNDLPLHHPLFTSITDLECPYRLNFEQVYRLKFDQAH